MWMYFEINKKSIPNHITKEIFNNLTLTIKDKFSKTPCPYFNFNEKHHEPTKLMKLRIFNYNVDTFQYMLKDVINSDNCSLIRYINKCIEVYRDMNSKYCTGSDGTTEENQNSCDIIRKFDNLYSSYIYNKGGIFQNFPSLSSNTPTKVISGCRSEEIESYPDSQSQINQSDRSIIQSVPPALGVMAGIPPFLALIYK
ncbi:hypothetical protein PCYB_007280, partial [Plasmodium cynomolgi strain B]